MILDLRDLYLSMLAFVCFFEGSASEFNHESPRVDEIVHGGCEWVLYSHIQRLAERQPVLVILYAMENAGDFSMHTAAIVDTLRNRAFDDLITQQSVLGRLEDIFSAHESKSAHRSGEVKYA